jgi:hypothetical protein
MGSREDSMKVFIIRGIGNNRTISKSKIRKIIVNKKKWRENGIRAEFIGSNPHSKGEDFSRSFEERVEIIIVINPRQLAINKIIKKIRNLININIR